LGRIAATPGSELSETGGTVNPTDRLARAPKHDEIARRAYQLFEERGREPGRELEDWFRAEREYEQG
jgi:hypothetical protein